MRIIKRQSETIREHNDYCIESEFKDNLEAGLSPMASIRKAYNDYFTDFTGHHGRYPIVFINNGAVYCAECAKKLVLFDYNNLRDAVSSDLYYEGENLYCDSCNFEIESAYGNPGADNDDNE